MGRGVLEQLREIPLRGRRPRSTRLDALVEAAQQAPWPATINRDDPAHVLLGEEVPHPHLRSDAGAGRDVHRPGSAVRAQLEALLEIGEAALEEYEASPLAGKLLKAKGKLDRLRRQRYLVEGEWIAVHDEADRLASEEINRMLSEHGYRGSIMLMVEMPAERTLDYVEPLPNYYGVRTPKEKLPQLLAEIGERGREVKRERLAQSDVAEIRGRRDAIPVYRQALEVNRIAQQRVNEIVARFRQVGGEQLPTPKNERRGGGPQAYEMLRQAAEILPADWALSSREFFAGRGGALVATAGAERASYTHAKENRFATVSYGRDDHGLPPAVLTHELVHHYEEARPQLRVAEWAFWQKRVRGGDFDGELAPLRSIYRDEGSVTEVCREGGFDEPYAAKSYGGDWRSSYELLSHGLERLLWPAANIKSDMRRLNVTSDREYTAFLLGALICL